MKSTKCLSTLASLLLALCVGSAHGKETADAERTRQPGVAGKPRALSQAGVEQAGELTGPAVPIWVRGFGSTETSTIQVLRSGDLAIAEGDIVVGNYSELTENFSTNSAFVVDLSKRWPKVNGLVQVPYVLDSSLSSTMRERIQAAINDFQAYTCIRFVQRTNQADYVDFRSLQDGCYAWLGRTGGQQPINLQDPGCGSKGTVIHEMNHTLGMIHEQSRMDRDNYVTINYNNIISGWESQFEKNSNTTTQGFGYDYYSVMHYPDWGFSSNGKPTITTKDPAYQDVIGQRAGFSKQDIAALKVAYQCGAP